VRFYNHLPIGWRCTRSLADKESTKGGSTMQTTRHILRISGPPARGGRPTFAGVGSVMASIGTAAREATCMRFRHASKIKGRRPDWLREAADLNPVDIQDAGDHSKIVIIEAPMLGEAAAEVYKKKGLFDTFPSEQETALDVLGQTVRVIAARNATSEWYDTDLLKRMEKFRPFFKQLGVCAVGLATLNGAGIETLPTATIDQATIDAAESLHRQSPKARRVRISGKLDMLRDSDRAFDLLLTDHSRIRGVWEDDLGAIIALLGKQVVVDALAVFRPSGSLLRIEAGGMDEAGADDAYFSKMPKPAPSKIDLRTIHQPQAANTGLAAVYGRWPGDESEAQLLAALKGLD